MATSSNLNVLYTGSWDNSIQRIEIEMLTSTKLPGVTHDDCINCLIMDQHEKYLFSGSNDMHLKQWVIGQNITLIKDFGKIHESAINCLAITNDNKYIFSASKDRVLKQWKVDAGIIYKNYGKVSDSEITSIAIIKRNTIFLE